MSSTIDVLYDGLGVKHRQTITTNGSVTLTRDYLEGIDYKDNQLEAVYHPEGRAVNTGGTYRYEYVLRDHLGNTRLVFCDKDGNGGIDNSEIIGEYHYYPFGQRMEGAWYKDAGAVPYRYLYNGKELTEEFGLNFYDYGARWYDPNLGSWWQLDPLSEVGRRWSPYVFSNNNPLRFVDVDGRYAAENAGWTLKGRVEAYNLANQASGELGLASQFGQELGGDPPTKGKKAMPEPATLSAYEPDMADNWREGNLVQQFAYGVADGVYSMFADNHLGGRGFDSYEDKIKTRLGGLITFGGPLLGGGTAMSSTERQVLYHYTTEKGMNGIVNSRKLNPSLKALNPNDVRYGEGQYLSDIVPGTKSPAQLARTFVNVPNRYKYTHYVGIDVTGLNVQMGRDAVYIIPNTSVLNISGRIVSFGKIVK